MKTWMGCTRLGLAAMLAIVVTDASAQTTYRCRSGDSTYLSDRPCTTGPGGKLAGIGPVAPRYVTPAPSYQPSIGKAPDHLPYLSPACASLNDAIRTAPARGLKGGVISDLHTEYRSKCSDEESEAYQALSRDRNQQRSARASQQAALSAEKAEAVREREQCQELLRILHGKRQRLAEMSVGEKADFERSDGNYRARCAAR